MKGNDPFFIDFQGKSLSTKSLYNTNIYKALNETELHKSMEVATAFAVAYYGLAVYFAAESGGVQAPAMTRVNCTEA
jgi:hypothetical protein